ncbi:MAG: hypothetical protein OHK0029_09800 [Armatimonadaceae bacterium]
MATQLLLPGESTTRSRSRYHQEPDAVAFREAIQSPGALVHPRFRGARVALDRRGLPIAYTGRFAIVFRVRLNDGQDWAVRCYTNDPLNPTERTARFSMLEQRLNDPQLSGLFAPFEYLPAGIRVAGETYPVLAMPWREGTALGEWVEQNRQNPAALLTLARTLGEARERMRRAGIAHGDWQHDNILVSDGGRRVAFVDYDGMYCPELAGQPAPEAGHPNYQHPARRPGDFHADLDLFPCFLMQTALVALAVEPTLWDSFNDGESLLFRHEDLIAPDQSALFSALRLVGDQSPEVKNLTRHLQDSLDLGKMPEPVCSAVLESLSAKMGVILGLPVREIGATNTGGVTVQPSQQTIAQQIIGREFAVRRKHRAYFGRLWRRSRHKKHNTYLFLVRLVMLYLVTCTVLQFMEMSGDAFVFLTFSIMALVAGYFFWLPNLQNLWLEGKREQTVIKLEAAQGQLNDVKRRLRSLNRSPENLSAVTYISSSLHQVWLFSPQAQKRLRLTADERKALTEAKILRLSEVGSDLPGQISPEAMERLWSWKQEQIEIARAAYRVLAEERKMLQVEQKKHQKAVKSHFRTVVSIKRRKNRIGTVTFARFVRHLVTK